jgi:hypothetical protein
MYPAALEAPTTDAAEVVLMTVGTAAVGDPFIVITKVAVGTSRPISEVTLTEACPVETPLNICELFTVAMVTPALTLVKVAAWADTSDRTLAGIGAMVNPLLLHTLVQ